MTFWELTSMVRVVHTAQHVRVLTICPCLTWFWSCGFKLWGCQEFIIFSFVQSMLFLVHQRGAHNHTMVSRLEKHMSINAHLRCFKQITCYVNLFFGLNYYLKFFFTLKYFYINCLYHNIYRHVKTWSLWLYYEQFQWTGELTIPLSHIHPEVVG